MLGLQRKSKLFKLNRYLIRHRLLILLGLLLSLLCLFPILHNYLFINHFSVMEFFLSLILFTSIYLFSSNVKLLLNITLLALLTVTIIWFNFFLKSRTLTIAALGLEITYFSITTCAILKHVLSFKRATVDKLYGAICGYLLIGIIWALIYTLIEVITPNSFFFTEHLKNTFDQHLSYPVYFLYFVYYSFVTISTLGYGDITPLSHAARVFSSLESIIGQLYVAILISRLVGMQIIHTQNQK